MVAESRNKMKQMKDSGIEWIGEVPQHWTLQKIATLYQVRNQKVSDKDFPPLSVTMKGIVPQLETAAKTNDGDNRKLVRVGDFAINSRSDRRGSCGISSYDGSVSLINTVLTPKGEMNPKYYNWLFHTVQFADEYYKCGHGIVDDLWTTTWQEMKRITIPTPPIDEQREIAEFLDKKCKEVDGLIADIQTQIDTLEQYKRSTITKAVTKGNGIFPKFIDSEIQLSLAIPSGWAIVKFKVICEHKSEVNSGDRELLSVYLDRGVIRYSDSTNMQVHKPSESLDKYQNVDIGDFVMNNQQAWRGSVGVSKYRGIISPAYHIFSLSKACNPNYMNYLFRDNFMVQQYEFCSRGVGSIQRNIYVPWLKNCLVLLPPIDEQKSIAEYLDKKCAEIDACIEEKKQQISVLETYKKSIIFEYVTGKKEV